MKEILTDCIPKKYVVTDDMSIASSGLAKLFVGELIETALDVLRERMALEGQWLQETSGKDTTETAVSSSSSRYVTITNSHLSITISYYSSLVLTTMDNLDDESQCSSGIGLGQRLQVQHIQEAYRRMRCEGKH